MAKPSLTERAEACRKEADDMVEEIRRRLRRNTELLKDCANLHPDTEVVDPTPAEPATTFKVKLKVSKSPASQEV